MHTHFAHSVSRYNANRDNKAMQTHTQAHTEAQTDQHNKVECGDGGGFDSFAYGARRCHLAHSLGGLALVAGQWSDRVGYIRTVVRWHTRTLPAINILCIGNLQQLETMHTKERETSLSL